MNTPSVVPIPTGPLLALTEALIRLGQPMAEGEAPGERFLINRPKAIVVPWFGQKQDDFNKDRGDGSPILAVPPDPRLARLPHTIHGTNVLMGVPTWLVQTPCLYSLHTGASLDDTSQQVNTTICVGFYYPALSTMRLDYYRAGSYACRQWVYHPNLGEPAMAESIRMRKLAAEWDADMGDAPCMTPVFNHRLLDISP